MNSFLLFRSSFWVLSSEIRFICISLLKYGCDWRFCIYAHFCVFRLIGLLSSACCAFAFAPLVLACRISHISTNDENTMPINKTVKICTTSSMFTWRKLTPSVFFSSGHAFFWSLVKIPAVSMICTLNRSRSKRINWGKVHWSWARRQMCTYWYSINCPNGNSFLLAGVRKSLSKCWLKCRMVHPFSCVNCLAVICVTA